MAESPDQRSRRLRGRPTAREEAEAKKPHLFPKKKPKPDTARRPFTADPSQTQSLERPEVLESIRRQQSVATPQSIETFPRTQGLNVRTGVGLSDDINRRSVGQFDSRSRGRVRDSERKVLRQQEKEAAVTERVERLATQERGFFDSPGFRRVGTLTSVMTGGEGVPIEQRSRVGRLSERVAFGILGAGPAIPATAFFTGGKIAAAAEVSTIPGGKESLRREKTRASIEAVSTINPLTEEGQAGILTAVILGSLGAGPRAARISKTARFNLQTKTFVGESLTQRSTGALFDPKTAPSELAISKITGEVTGRQVKLTPGGSDIMAEFMPPSLEIGKPVQGRQAKLGRVVVDIEANPFIDPGTGSLDFVGTREVLTQFRRPPNPRSRQVFTESGQAISTRPIPTQQTFLTDTFLSSEKVTITAPRATPQALADAIVASRKPGIGKKGQFSIGRTEVIPQDPFTRFDIGRSTIKLPGRVRGRTIAETAVTSRTGIARIPIFATRSRLDTSLGLRSRGRSLTQRTPILDTTPAIDLGLRTPQKITPTTIIELIPEDEIPLIPKPGFPGVPTPLPPGGSSFFPREPPPPPRSPLIPIQLLFGDPLRRRKRKRRGIELGTRGFSFTPDLTALGLNIRGRAPNIVTGLGIRPITPGSLFGSSPRRKRKKKK